MLFAIFNSILSAISNVMWKKTLHYEIPAFLNTFFGYVTGIIFVLYFVFVAELSNISLFLIGGFFLTAVIDIIRNSLSNSIYKNEKISTLMPYTNLNKVFTIIASFFLFSDVSLPALGVTLLVVVVIVLFSIDFKTLKFPKNIIKMFIYQGLTTISSLIIGYFVLGYGAMLVFMADYTIGTSLLIGLCLYFGMFSKLKNLDKGYYIPRLTGSTLGWGGYALSLVIISELGLSLSILLSFVSIGITLLFSFLILGDKPSKKDLLMTIIVSALVGIGFYFK